MSLMDILGGGQPPQPGMGAQPEGPPEQGGGHSEIITEILDMVRQAAQAADDEQEALTWEKIGTMIQSIKAAQEKQDREMLQGKMPPGALQRVLSGS